MSLALQNGLNVPQFSSNTLLDQVFADLERFLAIDESSTAPDALTQLYEKTRQNTSDPDSVVVVKPTGRIRSLLEYCLAFIHSVQDLSLQTAQKQRNSADPQKANLITISLHDMKYFNELLNVVIVQCIYPCLPIGVGIPLDQRRLKSFGKRTKSMRYQLVPQSDSTHTFDILDSVVRHFEVVFDKGGDIAELLMKGSGLTDVLTSLMVLSLECDESKFLPQYIAFEKRSDSFNLFGIYTSLIQASKVPKYQRFLSERLTRITIDRPNGVISLIDFVVGLRDDEEINIEKFNHVNRILLAKPKEISSVRYFTKLFEQIYDILVYINRPVLLSVVVNFVRVLYDKNKRIIHDFLFKKVWKCFDPEVAGEAGATLVTEKELNDSINVLISLTKESSPEFLNELFGRVILNLWCYYFYLKKNKMEYHKIVSNVLVSFFTITSNNEFLENIVLNLINSQGEGWKFNTTLENKLTSIVRSGPFDDEISSTQILDDIDLGLEVFVDLLRNLGNEVVRHQFLVILNRWILKQRKATILDEENPFIMLIDLKLLERLNEVFKDVLLDKPENVLQVIKNLLSVKFEPPEDESREVDSDDEDSDSDEQEVQTPSDHLSILLELLSAIITETPHPELAKHKPTLKDISQLLTDFPQNKHSIALHKRIEDFLNDNQTNILEDDERAQDKELFEKAIANMNDPLVPIRAHGLYLLRQLIIKRSKVLTLDFVLELHILQLQDQEPFIYLNVIKSLNELIELDKDETARFLMKFYSEKKEKLDSRLKIGEVIVNFIDKSGELLTGELVDSIISTTLSIVRDFEEDNRVRMSAMSLIGEALRVNATGLDKFIKDALDCSIGILELEKEMVMKRAAVVLIADLMAFGGLEIVPRGYGARIKRVLEYSRLNAGDFLLVEQIDKVLEVIDDLLKEKFRASEMPSQFDALKISK